MNPVLSGVILLLLIALRDCRAFPHVILSLFINSDTISSEDSSFFWVLGFEISFDWLSFRLYVVKRRCKVDIDISVDDAYGVVLILRGDFEDVNFKLILEDLNANGVSLMQTGKVSELVLQDGFGVLHIDEFGLVRL